MHLFLRALDVVHDVVAGAPEGVGTAVMIAFPICLLVAWGMISSWVPKLGLVLNLAIIALVVVEVVALRAAAPSPGELSAGFQMFIPAVWVGETILGVLGVAGLAVALVRMFEKPALEAGELADP